MSKDELQFKDGKLPTLYKRNTNGSKQEWTIEVEGNKFRTIIGKVGGKLVTSEWTVCGGKNTGRANATTGEQQAEKEAKADFQKKLDKGYTLDVDNIDEAAMFQVMLAHSIDDYWDELLDGYDLKQGVHCQPKLDGIRCRIDKDGNMWTRNNKKIVACPHIAEELKPVLKQLKKGQCLDGELYNHEFKHNFNRICELVKKQKMTPELLAQSKQLVQFWWYDITDNNKVFSDRYDFLLDYLLKYRFAEGNKNTSIIVVHTEQCITKKQLDDLYEHWMELGYEGQIIRLDTVYENKRTKSLLKRKEFKDAEYTIKGVVEGDGNRAGTVGYMEFETKEGRSFRSNVKGPFEFLKELLQNREELIGKQATLKYFNLTPDGVPRFPYVVALRDYE